MRLAAAIAAEDHNLYLLCGLHPGRPRLRVPVTRFDDVRLTALVERSVVAIAIQGVAGEEVVHLGGANRRLLEHLQSSFEGAGSPRGPAGRTSPRTRPPDL